GRLPVPARVEARGPAAAGGEGRAVGDALGDVALAPVALPLGGQRAHLALGAERVADAHLAERGGQRLEQFVMPGPGDDDPGERGADLPGKEALRLRQGARRRLDVDV